MENNQTPSPEIAGVIDSLPQVGSEPQETRKRVSTKRRRKRTAKRSAPTIPSSSEEPRSKMFLTTFANLALLVAVLTIVFAAHKAVQNRQQVTEQTIDNTLPAGRQGPLTIDQTVQKAEPASEPQVIAEPTEPAQPVTQTEPAKPTKLVKPSKRVDRYSSDPYTNSGPLDLDRRGDTQTTPVLPSAHSATVTDSKNPWNSGGQLDLDSETNRRQYKKALSLAE